jgi:hypothetical protein
MILQNDQLNNFSRKTRDKGGQQEGLPGPDGNRLKTKPGEVAARKMRNPRRKSVQKTPTRELKRIHGESQGRNQPVEEELRRRGFNSKMLAEIEWEYGQRQWCKAAKKASEVSRQRKRRVKSARFGRKRAGRREQTRERLRQKQKASADRVRQGFVIVGENYDPAAADGLCPF